MLTPLERRLFVIMDSSMTRLVGRSDAGGAGAGALGDSLAKPELARKFHDNAVSPLPEERAAEIRGPNARPS
jgi:hypothetical protein